MKQTLLAANIALTSRCNLKCKHCGANNSNTELPLSDLLAVIWRLKDYGVQHIIFAGGEPFCRSELFTIFDECERAEISFAILTNGTMADAGTVQRLQQYRYLRYIRISVDYASAEKMDAFRGMHGILYTIRTFAGMLKDAEIPFGIGLTIMDDNLTEIEPVAVMAKEMGAAFFRASPVVAIGKSAGQQHDAAFYRDAILSMFRIREKLGIGEEYPFMRLPRDLRKLNVPFYMPCPGGIYEISVMADGTVNRCPLSPVDDAVNLHRMSLDETIERVAAQANPAHESCTSCTERQICCCGCPVELESSGRPLCFREILDQVAERCEGKRIRIYGTVYYEQKRRQNPADCIRSSALWVIPFVSA